MRRRLFGVAASTVASIAVAAPLAAVVVDAAPTRPMPLSTSSASAMTRLTRGIAAAVEPSLVDQGTANAWAALAECRKGDYPGGGSGLLSLPAPGRSNARSDHCWR